MPEEASQPAPQPQVTVGTKSHDWKKVGLTVLIILVVAGLIVAAYWFLVLNKGSEDSDLTGPVPQVTTKTSTESAEEATKSATPISKKAEETESDAVLLKKVVSEKTGINIDIVIVDVEENTGKHAKGLVTAKGEMMGGGYWLALKTDGKWSVVFDGQNTPECTLVDPSGFPVDMVPECVDVNGNVVTRN